MTMVTTDDVIACVGGPVEWLQQGNTPVARVPQGIIRVAPDRQLQQEQRHRHPAFAPHIAQILDIAGHPALLEADLGRATVSHAVLDAFHQSTPPRTETVQGTVGDVLTALHPHGAKPKLTPFIRSLRSQKQLGTPLPFVPRQQKLQRALSQPISITVSRGWTHGALTPARMFAQGLCHWRHARMDGIQETDTAALLAPEDATTAQLMVMVASNLRHNPLRAARALFRLNLGLQPTPETAVLHITAHRGIPTAVLEQIVNCPIDVPSPAQRVAQALSRARRLNIGGQPVTASSSPPIPVQKDSHFWLPRGRDHTDLFAKWADVRLMEDEQARYSLTPEAHALRIATQMKVDGRRVLDAFCGAGGNAIAFARRGAKVVAMDTDARRLSMAKHNAKVYGVSHQIEFRQGDFFRTSPRADVVFLDPPWEHGEDLINRAWRRGRSLYPTGTIKLPRTHTVPDEDAIAVYTTKEGFPSFITVSWDRHS